MDGYIDPVSTQLHTGQFIYTTSNIMSEIIIWLWFLTFPQGPINIVVNFNDSLLVTSKYCLRTFWVINTQNICCHTHSAAIYTHNTNNVDEELQWCLGSGKVKWSHTINPSSPQHCFSVTHSCSLVNTRRLHPWTWAWLWWNVEGSADTKVSLKPTGYGSKGKESKHWTGCSSNIHHPDVCLHFLLPALHHEFPL